jgi:hypothetical protein
MGNLKPVNVAGATIVVQVCLLVIIGLGVAFERDRALRSTKQRSYALALVLAILTIIAVALSADYYPVWSPLLGDLSLPTIARSHAFMFVFLLDIGASMLLINWTGGTRASPFTAVLFLIPALAMFLREPPWKFFTYSIIVGVYYYFTCAARFRETSLLPVELDASLHSHRVVNIGCLALATITGYITRPVPI